MEYGLDPKSVLGADGFWGDPDGDGLLNSQEYLGQDGERSTNRPHVNGSGDETNPNEHNWRPDSTGSGPGIMRPSISNDYWRSHAASPTNGTLGAALPTASLGTDDGLDTDDDGISDDVEIQMEYFHLGIEPSPVHSMSPFIKRAAMIRNDQGIAMPDPEGSVSNFNPLLHKRDWTVECYVKLLATNMTGLPGRQSGPVRNGRHQLSPQPDEQHAHDCVPHARRLLLSRWWVRPCRRASGFTSPVRGTMRTTALPCMWTACSCRPRASKRKRCPAACTARRRRRSSATPRTARSRTA